MTAQEISDLIWERYPYTYRNNRGCAKINGKFVRFGIPEPNGHAESDDSMKGGDRIGFVQVEITPEMVGKNIAIFASFEIKTAHDRLMPGQIDWHNFVIEKGGISQIWKEKEVISERIGKNNPEKEC